MMKKTLLALVLAACAAAPMFAAAPPKLTVARLGKAEIGPRDLCIDTVLVRDGKAAAAIVIPATPEYHALAAKVNAAVKAKTGAELPLVADESLRELRKLDRNCLMLGNRDRNQAIANLYNLHFTLLDAKYPGPGGNELRSLHNPFGDGYNIIFAGGSLAADDAAAAEKLIRAIGARPPGKNLTLGFLAEVTLSPEYEGKIARDVKDIPLWERSSGYGNKGYFGWNSLSKNLAMLYVTNDRYYADEFLRLAFPKDGETVKELRRRDDESYKDEITDPIKSVYHYRGIMMILYWAMVEANPHFTDADREKVNRAFYRQLVYTLTKSSYSNPYRYDRPGFYKIGRHETWEVVGAYATARFFATHYPCFDADEALRLARNAMAGPLERQALGSISRYWHQTLLEPLFVYAALAGGLDRVGSPVLREYGKSLLLLSDLSRIPGYQSDRMMVYSSPFMLNLFGYLCRDEAFTALARRLPDREEKVFRLGQSFDPAEPYPHDFFRESAGHWSLYRLHPEHLPVKPPFEPAKAVQAMSFREKADGSGDFLLLDTRYAPGLRETPHAFSILNYLHQGVPVLRGHGNTMRFYADGMNIPELCYYAEITAHGRAGDCAYVTAKMDRVDDFAWERTLILKPGGYLLIVDDISPLRDMKNGEFCNDFLILRDRAAWQTARTGELGIHVGREYGAHDFSLSMSVPAEPVFDEMGYDTQQSSTRMARFSFDRTNLKKGETIRFATLVRPGAPGARPMTAQQGDEIALLLPEPALLTLDDEALTLAGPSGTLTRRGDVWSCTPGVPDAALEAKVKSILAARPVAVAAEKDASVPAAAWECKFDGPVRLLKLFRAGGTARFAVSTGRVLLVGEVGGGLLWKREFAADLGVIEFQASRERLLVGCKDEKLVALDLDGQPAWEFTSEMAPELLKNGDYWHKSGVPGIRSLRLSAYTGEERIYLGSAGTVEVLDADGGFLARRYILYGPISALVEQPAADGRPARLLTLRTTGGGPQLFSLDADYRVKNLGMNRDTAGLDLGSFGFNGVGRMALLPVRLRPGDPLRLVGDLSGGHNRIGVWDLDGKIRHDANLGPGLASSTGLPYGEAVRGARFFKGLAALDFDGDGELEIVTATRNRRLLIWSPEMRLRAGVRLPAAPQLVAAVPAADRAVVALEDGVLLSADGDGGLAVLGRLPGAITALDVMDDTVCAGDRSGNLAQFQLNRPAHRQK